MEQNLSSLKLPKVLSRSTSINSELSTKRNTPRSSLQCFLEGAKQQQCFVKRWQKLKEEEGLKRMSVIKKKCQQLSKLQVRVYDQKERVSLCSEDEKIIEEQALCGSLCKYDTIYKPPHRYRTALTYYEGSLFMFGGFGCQKYLGLVKYSLKQQQWEPSKIQDKTDLAVFGHTLTAHKGYGYVFGGVRMDSPINQLLQINLKTSEVSQLNHAPYRRRDHASAMLARFMVVQGGIDGPNQVKNCLFYLDTQSGKWTVPLQYHMPFLSYHSLVVVPQKSRKKNYAFNEVLGENLYIFGGKSQKEVSSNKLFKVKARESGDLTTQQVMASGGPLPRHSACVQFIDPCYICVYGGRSDCQSSGQKMSQGIFNDLVLFHIDKREWVVPSLSNEMPFRYGASCVSVLNKLYVFGGSDVSSYSDGVLLQLGIAREGEQESMEDAVSRRGHLRG